MMSEEGVAFTRDEEMVVKWFMASRLTHLPQLVVDNWQNPAY